MAPLLKFYSSLAESRTIWYALLFSGINESDSDGWHLIDYR